MADAVGPKRPAGDMTILIVDDDEDILGLLEILVHRDGFKIVTASGGEEAISKLAEGPNGLVLDLIMPGAADGFTVLEAVESLPFPPPVIVVTGSPSASDLDRASRSPVAKAVIKKPIRQEELLTALHKALNTVPSPPQKPAAAD
ncbi:MAG: response regulator [Elusimicrobia bacterium]|nr:response regulator [Elusimicrobiota bacterium]